MKIKEVLLTAIIIVSIAALPINTKAVTLQEYENEVAKYQSQINEKKAQLAKNNETIASVQAKIKSYQSQIQKNQEEQERLQKEIDDSNEKSKQEITDESVELDAQVEKISSSNVNDLQANIGGAAELLTRNGIKDLILSFCGKLFYAFSATILLGAVGFMVAIRKIWEAIINKVKRRNETPWGTLQWYVFFSFFALCNSLGVSAIFKCMPFYREGALYLCQVETIVFGRYADFALGGVMVLGIYGLYHCKEYFLQIIISVMGFLGLSWIVQYQFDAMIVNLANDKIADFRINQTPWCYILSNGDINYFAYYVAVVSLGIFSVLLFMSFYSKKRLNLFAMGMLAVCIMWGAMEVKYSDEYNQSKSYRDDQIKTVWNWIEMTDSNTDIYYIGNNYGDVCEYNKVVCKYSESNIQDIELEPWIPIKKIHVKKGQKVKSGDVLITVVAGDIDEKIAEYEYQIKMKETQISQARHLCELEVKRQKELMDDKVAIRAIEERYDADISNLTAELEVQKTGLEQALEEREDFEIKATIDGTVTYVDNHIAKNSSGSEGEAFGFMNKEKKKVVSISDGSMPRFTGSIDTASTVSTETTGTTAGTEAAGGTASAWERQG